MNICKGYTYVWTTLYISNTQFVVMYNIYIIYTASLLTQNEVLCRRPDMPESMFERQCQK